MRIIVPVLALTLLASPAFASGPTVIASHNDANGGDDDASQLHPLPVVPTAPGGVPVVSTANEASHVLKNAPGWLYAIYASGLQGGSSANLLVLNQTSVGTDGAVTPIICIPFANGIATIPDLLGRQFTVGMVAVISSASNCFTQTTSSETGFISAVVQ